MNVFCVTSKMNFKKYLDSFPIPKIHSFSNNFNSARAFIASSKNNEIDFANWSDFPLGKCPTITSHCSTITASLSNSYSGSNWALEITRVLGAISLYEHGNSVRTLWVRQLAIILLLRNSCLTFLFFSFLARFWVYDIYTCFSIFEP